MRSNAVKKTDFAKDTKFDIASFKDELPVTPSKQILQLVEKQAEIYNEDESESTSVDYEEFLDQYGIKSDFA